MDLRNTPRQGPEAAPVEIVVFSDFQCPHCRNAARQLKKIHRSRPNKVKIFFKHYPLERHPQALNAAMATEAAGLQGKFWQMHDLLFSYSSQLGDEIYVQLATDLELDVEKFKADFDSQAVATKIAADVAEGNAIGVNGTPYFIVDKRPYRGSASDLFEHVKGL